MKARVFCLIIYYIPVIKVGSNDLYYFAYLIKRFQANIPFLYRLNTAENQIFVCFQGVYKEHICLKWFKDVIQMFLKDKCFWDIDGSASGKHLCWS